MGRSAPVTTDSRNGGGADCPKPTDQQAQQEIARLLRELSTVLAAGTDRLEAPIEAGDKPTPRRQRKPVGGG